MLLTRFKAWSDANVLALESLRGAMTQENNKTFELFRRARMRSVLPRLYGLLAQVSTGRPRWTMSV